MGTSDNRTTPTTNGDETRDNGVEFIIKEEPIKRGRGRPKGSRNKGTGTGTENGTGTTNKSAGTKEKKTKASRQEAEQVSKFIVAMIEANVSFIAPGKDTNFTPQEKMLIEPSLAHIMERLDISTIDRYAPFIDWAMLAGGLMMWGSRIFKDNKNANKAS